VVIRRAVAAGAIPQAGAGGAAGEAIKTTAIGEEVAATGGAMMLGVGGTMEEDTAVEVGGADTAMEEDTAVEGGAADTAVGLSRFLCVVCRVHCPGGDLVWSKGRNV